MKFWVHRSLYTALVALIAVSQAVFIPVSLFTNRWLYISTPSEVTISSAGEVIRTSSVAQVTYGVLGVCRSNATSDDCSSIRYDGRPDMPFADDCARSQSQLQHRVNVAAAFSVISFIAAVPLAVLALMTSSAASCQKFGLAVFGVSVFPDARYSCKLQLGLVLTVFASELIAVAVYGATIGSWANCGQHYCQAVEGITNRAALAVQYPRGVQVCSDFVVECGFRSSYAFAVAATLFAFGMAIMLVADLVTLPEGATAALATSNGDLTSTTETAEDREPESKDRVAHVAQHFEDERHTAGANEAEPTRNDGVQPELHHRHVSAERSATQPESRMSARGRIQSPADKSDDEGSVIMIAEVSTRPQHGSASFVHETVEETVLETSTDGNGRLVANQRVVSSTVRGSSSSTKGTLLPEGDDWEFDDEENLYWSPSQQLFFDHASGHFYDPASGAWFNPILQRWYQL